MPTIFSFMLLTVVALIVSQPAQAQQPKKIPRVGYLSSLDPTREASRLEAIRLGLREMGYNEGKNIIIEYRFAEGSSDRLPELAAELVRLRTDVIIAAGAGTVVRAAQTATQTIPVVMSGGGIDPVEAGFVNSLSRPGGNITGITNLGPELGSKRLELLKETAPGITRVAVLYDPANPPSLLQVKKFLPNTARAFGLTILPSKIRGSDDFDKALAALNEQRPDGLFVLGGPLMYANQKRTIGFALKSRLPSVYNRRQDVDAGGLIAYGADLADGYRRVAIYVDKILKGAKPADLPVEQPRKFELVINLKTAKQIGLTIPPNVLARADKVIR